MAGHCCSVVESARAAGIPDDLRVTHQDAKAVAIADRFNVKARSTIRNAPTSEPSDSWTFDRGQIAVNEPRPEPQLGRKV